jgi:hypothetical protein
VTSKAAENGGLDFLRGFRDPTFRKEREKWGTLGIGFVREVKSWATVD